MDKNTGNNPDNFDRHNIIKGNTLYYEYTGNNTYTEDFIQTTEKFPINDTRVEFEIRAKAATSLGYVGPSALWATDGENRTGVLAVTDKVPLIGVQAFYGWESNGTKGVVFQLGGIISNNTNGIFRLEQDFMIMVSTR